PERPPLLRFLLIRLGERRHRLVITIHHILLDGWSLSVFVRELLASYRAGGNAGGLPPLASYGASLAWCGRQDREPGDAAWLAELAGLDEPTLVAAACPAPGAGDPERHRFSANAGLTAALTRVAREHGLTLNTVVQGAWALVLSRLSGRRDVVFGAVVAGRPPELPGIEDM